MPQLDKVTLFSQVFWLLLLYFVCFLFFVRYSLPRFSYIFKARFHLLRSAIANVEYPSQREIFFQNKQVFQGLFCPIQHHWQQVGSSIQALERGQFFLFQSVLQSLVYLCLKKNLWYYFSKRGQFLQT